jgi:UPF0755 protein
VKYIAVGAAFCLVLGGLVAVVSIGRNLSAPRDPAADPVLFEVAEGEPLGSVADRLAEQGLVHDGMTLTLWARLRGTDRQVKSGQYELSAAYSPVEILRKITAGEVKTWAVTLPEGLTLEEVAARLDEAGITEAADLVALARDPAYARTLDVEADSLEGYLFPETYRFRSDTEPAQVLEQMAAEFRAAWQPDDLEALDTSGMTLHEVVTLASIVEKETGAPDERPRIAAVFHNRLRKGMRLQSDPTVIYGVLREKGEFDGNIRRRDLETDTAYNTYTRSGLPPGPISSASMASIRAVLAPEDVPYLYFVSQNDGTHHFSTTLREHVNAVNKYQKRRKRGADES